jgi:hypothetical protein
MSVTFQIERWADFIAEADPLMERHWQESALDQERFKRKLNQRIYEDLEAKGMLHLLTVRRAGKLVGYYIADVFQHPHDADAGPMGFTDIYFVAPEERKAGLGIRLFVEAFKGLYARGAVKIYVSHKVHQDLGPILRTLGGRKSDVTYTFLPGGVPSA